MDLFDQYLFDELAAMYAKKTLTSGELEELYIRMGNLDHLEEVHPYLFAMRYLGWGTRAQPKQVLEELKKLRKLAPGDVKLEGLYEDLVILSGNGTKENREKLKFAAGKGYSNIYLKEKSALAPAPGTAEKKSAASASGDADWVKVKGLEIECRNKVGISFETMDVDYLCARVYVEPANTVRRLRVSSQIFTSAGKPQSKVFSDEIVMKAGETSFRTTGWGSKDVGSYPADTYRWTVKIEGNTTVSETTFKITKKPVSRGLTVDRVVLFASKLSQALPEHRERYQTSFAGRYLECVYVKALLRDPGTERSVNGHLKIEHLDSGTVVHDSDFVQDLPANCTSLWRGVGYNGPGQWKNGRYRYTLYLGSCKNQGTFTVY